MRRGAPGDEAAGIRQRASGSGHQAAGRLREEEAAPSPSGAELGGCTVATVADGGIANGHPEGPMTGRKIAKSPRDPPRQHRSPETVFLILSHLLTGILLESPSPRDFIQLFIVSSKLFT